MSGGSLDYVYRRIEDVSFDENTPLRRAFAKHLKLIAQALHDIEWVDSCDCSPGDEDAAISACLSRGEIHAQAEDDAKDLLGKLEEAIANLKAARDSR